MVEEILKKRVKEMEETGKFGSNTPEVKEMKEIKRVESAVPKQIQEAREEQLIWCAECYQELPATLMKSFECPVCGSKRYLTSRPF